MIHEKVHGNTLPMNSLLFEGSTYDLGWDGRRDTAAESRPMLPTPDHALFLINAVKFQCGQLFHLFDEQTFMGHFSKFHESDNGAETCSVLWYVHYLLVLAFGKALVTNRSPQTSGPSGSELFVQAMRMLPDITFLYKEPLQSIEILCCAALYLQCLDSRSAAYNIVRPEYMAGRSSYTD
jgi:proline utilization trans-activator